MSFKHRGVEPACVADDDVGVPGADEAGADALLATDELGVDGGVEMLEPECVPAPDVELVQPTSAAAAAIEPMISE